MKPMTSTSSSSTEENLLESDLRESTKLRRHAGRGADTFVSSTAQEDFGGRDYMQVMKYGKSIEHAYVRFDLSKSDVSRDQLDRAVLLLTMTGSSETNNRFNVYGIREGLDPIWAETGGGHLQWNDSPCRDGVGGQKYLGQFAADNSGGVLKHKTDRIRMASRELDDFLRSAEGDTVTIAIVRENGSASRLQFRTKVGQLSQLSLAVQSFFRRRDN